MTITEKVESILEKEEEMDSSLHKLENFNMVSELNRQEVEKILGYKFKNQKLLEEAFTDLSFHNLARSLSSSSSLCYNQLEHIGDSVLNLLITKELFFLYPHLSPGGLTPLRAANTNNEKLARVAIKLGLHTYFHLNKTTHAELVTHAELIQIFTEAIVAYPLYSHGLVNAPKVLADIVEASIRAMYIDNNCSIDTVWKVYKSLLEPMISLETLGNNPVSKLNEICQKKGLNLRFAMESWEKDTYVDVFIDEKLAGKAMDGMKKATAQTRAAQDALDKLDSLLAKWGTPESTPSEPKSRKQNF